MIWKIVGAFIAVAAFAIVLEVPKKYIWYAGGVGAAGWAVYLLAMLWELDMKIATFVAALVVEVIAHLLSRILKAPVTVFLIAGILPLVPGILMYQTAYYTISGNPDLAAYYLNQMLQISGMIALGVFVVDSIARMFLQKSGNQNL